jgi:hypothetical protein
MGILGEWFEKIPAVWKALGALGTAAVAGASITAMVIGGLSVPKQVSANTVAITRNVQAIQENTSAIAELNDTVSAQYHALANVIMVSICEQRQLHNQQVGNLAECMARVRRSLEEARVQP